MSTLSDSLTVFATVFAALFPVMNPLGSAPIFLSVAGKCSRPVQVKLARSVAINSFVLLFCSLMIGTTILNFFGVSLPALKLAGGAVIAVMGWGILNQDPSSSGGGGFASVDDNTASNSAFYPLTMPLAAGPGAIATMISLAAHYKSTPGFTFNDKIYVTIGCVAAIFALSVSIFLCFSQADKLQSALGKNGTNVLMKLLGFILLAIGVQIILGGWKEMMAPAAS